MDEKAFIEQLPIMLESCMESIIPPAKYKYNGNGKLPRDTGSLARYALKFKDNNDTWEIYIDGATPYYNRKTVAAAQFSKNPEKQQKAQKQIALSQTKHVGDYVDYLDDPGKITYHFWDDAMIKYLNTLAARTGGVFTMGNSSTAENMFKND